jgi:predicted RNase H-related nuclease YkuK (DUF458 family)
LSIGACLSKLIKTSPKSKIIVSIMLSSYYKFIFIYCLDVFFKIKSGALIPFSISTVPLKIRASSQTSASIKFARFVVHLHNDRLNLMFVKYFETSIAILPSKSMYSKIQFSVLIVSDLCKLQLF